MEVLQCQDKELELDSGGPTEPSVAIKQWPDMLEGRLIKKLVRTLKSGSKVQGRWKGRCQVCCRALTSQKGAFVLQCLGNVPGRWQPGRMSCRVCSMSADDSSEACLVVLLCPGGLRREAQSNYDFPFGTNLTPFPFGCKDLNISKLQAFQAALLIAFSLHMNDPALQVFLACCNADAEKHYSEGATHWKTKPSWMGQILSPEVILSSHTLIAFIAHAYY